MKLILSLSDKSEEFIHGMELGRLYERMSKKENPVINDGFPVRVKNQSAIERMCVAMGYTPIFGEEHYMEWIDFIAIKNVASKN